MDRIGTSHHPVIAKLLAKENIRVIYGNYDTAFFDPKDRVLGIPNWDFKTKDTADLIIGHEVGHALYTPPFSLTDLKQRCGNIPFAVINILEDIRIERLIQVEYPGLVGCFKRGYKNFIDDDFFKIRGKDVNEMGLLNRINLHAKIGGFVDVNFIPEEKAFYDRAYAAESFEEILNIAKELGEYINERAEEKPQPQPQRTESKAGDEFATTPPTSFPGDKTEAENGDGSDGGEAESATPDSEEAASETTDSQRDGNSQDGGAADDASDSDAKGKSAAGDETNTDGSGDSATAEGGAEPSESKDCESKQNHGNDQGGAPRSHNPTHDFNADTANNFQSSLNTLNESLQGTVYINVPSSKNIYSAVMPVRKVLELRRAASNYDAIVNHSGMISRWTAFKTEMKKDNEVLIKEFNRKKSAYEYSRATVSRSGVLNTSKIYSYRYDDNIFKSVTTLATAKNHGIIFFIDFSGSMSGVLKLVIEQALRLSFFCKSVNIPFSVYSFTSTNLIQNNGASETAENGANISYTNVVINELLNNTLKQHEFTAAARELFMQGVAIKLNSTSRSELKINNSTPGTIGFNSPREVLGSTPLNETVLAAHYIVSDFRKKYGVQKMNVMVLTDGAPSPIRYDFCNTYKSHDVSYTNRAYSSYSSKNYMNLFGEKIKLHNAYPSLVKSLKKYTQSNLISYFIATDAKNVNRGIIINALCQASDMKYSEAHRKCKEINSTLNRTGLYVISGGYNYDEFIISSQTYIKNAEKNAKTAAFDGSAENYVQPNGKVSTGKLKTAFSRYTNRKMGTNLFLEKFASIIA